jgi:hypothetical protein
MNYDTDAYEEAVSKWFEELKDIVTNDLLWQHINRYPEKKDFEIEAQSADGHKEKDDKISDSNEQPTVDK